MVLSQRQSHPQTSLPQLDFARILGMAGAIAVNATALMLLMIPIAAPPLPVEIDEPVVQPIFVRPEPIVIPEPPPPIPIQQPQRQERRQEATVPVPLPQTPDPPVLVEDGEQPPPVTETAIDPPPLPPSNPMPNARLQYASAPAPAYPRDALSKGLEGTVVLKVLVDVDGTPISVEIERSSGHFKLDDAAKRQVLRKWKFKPAIVDGHATRVYGIIPVSFSLTRE